MVHTGDIIFSTDQYLPDSIKSLERQRRGCGEKLLLGGGSTKRPTEWKLFLSNDENKLQLVKLLLKLWSGNEYASKLRGRKVIVICEGVAHLLFSEDGLTTKQVEIHSLRSTQEETDSRVILYSDYAKRKGYNFVRIKSPDSDIFFILLHFSPTTDINILFDTKIDNKPRLIDVSSIGEEFGQEKCAALLGLHAYTGCDTTSAFRGKGKIIPLKKALKVPRFISALAKLGNNWNTSSQVIDELELFTCTLYGGKPGVTNIDDLRLTAINKMSTKEGRSTPSNVDMSTLPPCRKSLIQHVYRVNYQVAIWKSANNPISRIPDASHGHGWVMTNEGLKPLWYEGESEPINLEDISEASHNEDSDDELDIATYMESDVESDVDSANDD